jgi:serine/threonine protein kinase
VTIGARVARAGRTRLTAVLGLGGDDPRRLGPYRLRAVVGDGGMGRVYLGTSPAGRVVAVKVIGPGLANRPGYRQRFAREARAAMAVSGLYTASVVDADTEGQRPYIATEFVAAPSLADSVESAGPLPVASVYALAGGLAEALAAIHRAGLVHRDVKPHNILLGADGPVVIDFGIARDDDSSLTAAGSTIGTPGYIAPEVLTGRDPTPASDVFSLACVLVYAARGVGPHGRGDPLSLAHRTVSQPPDLTGTPEPVRALVTPLLERDPARRPTLPQLLDQVARVSGTAVLHDAAWLPDGVRALLQQRRAEVQRLLSEQGAPTRPAPASTEPLDPAFTQQPTATYGYPPPGQPMYTPPAYAPTAARGGSRRTRYAVAGGALAAVGVTAAAIALTSGSTSAGSSSAYKPGTYTENLRLATDALGNTVTLQSIVVNGDGTVEARIFYTAALDSNWTCAFSTAREATLKTPGGAADPSTGSDCTQDPTKTWTMLAGQTENSVEYFAHAPAGSGAWSLTLSTREFHGTAAGITIPAS